MDSHGASSVPLTTISSEQLQKLLEISRRLSSTLRLDDLLNLVMEVSTELTNTETASILLLDRSTGQLHFAASMRGSVPIDIEVPLDDSIAGWVVRNKRSLILEDVQSDERFYENVDRDMDFITRTMLAVPLTTKQGVIGALEVINKRDQAPFTPQDVALMEAMASQAAVAIINVHLFNQSDLLAEIMHELKTPLMAISTASELLSRPDFPGKKRSEVVEMIKRESARLSKMTKDFLDFARLESGRVQLERQPVAIEEVVAEVVAISGSQAEARGINIETRFSHDLPQPDSPFTLIGDRNRLKQVLLNLVSNATKYNRQNGSITISVQCPQPDALDIGVADTGRGIAAEDMEHLFERFYRIPGSESAEGAGLGLSVAKKIVEEHDGRIAVKSAVGTGTTFIVSLPLHRSKA